MTPASLPRPSFCSILFQNVDSDEDWLSDLNTSAQQFVSKLNLPRIHPHCVEGYRYPPHILSEFTGAVPPPEISEISIESFMSDIVTVAYNVIRQLVGVAELLLRFVSIVVAPLAITYLLSEALQSMDNLKPTKMKPKTTMIFVMADIWACIFGVASCLVLLTDALYVLEFGRSLGCILWIVCSCLAIHACFTRERLVPYRTMVLTGLAILWIITVHLLLHSEDTDTTRGIDLPSYQEGFYASPRANPLIRRLIQAWPESQRTYSAEKGATPWLVTGDARSGVPYLLSGAHLGHDYFKRVFVSNPEDGEAVALDIAFPTNKDKKKTHDASKPLYLVLHGLTGDTDSNYIQAVVSRLNAEQSTVMVLVARGLMNTPIRGWNTFNGARISDLTATALAVRKSGVVPRRQVFAGVGLSLGGVVLSNYVARSGKACDLDVAISVSGALDTRELIDNQRSERLWQPALARNIKSQFLTGRFSARIRHRMGEERYHKILRSSTLVGMDKIAAVHYFGYRDANHYYSEMSAMGDQSVFRSRRRLGGDDSQIGRIANVAIPLCVVNSFDDPTIPWRAIAGRDPEALVNTGEGNLMVLVTKRGGHVGWPVGMFPSLDSWSWMSNVIRDYVSAYAKASGKTKEGR